MAILNYGYIKLQDGKMKQTALGQLCQPKIFCHLISDNSTLSKPCENMKMRSVITFNMSTTSSVCRIMLLNPAISHNMCKITRKGT